MKRLILLLSFAVLGCNEEPDKYDLAKSLTPTEVSKLHEVCKSQPNYDTSWVITRDHEAKGVNCRYREVNAGRAGGQTTYNLDAGVLKIKIQEGLK